MKSSERKSHALRFFMRNLLPIRQDWYHFLSNIGRRDPNLSHKQRARKEYYRTHGDLVDLVAKHLKSDEDHPLSDVVTPIVEFVQRDDYNIIDLFDEITTLKKALAHRSEDSDPSHAISDYTVLTEQLDNIFKLVASDTSAVFEEIVELGARAICLLDQNYRITYANPAACRILRIDAPKNLSLKDWIISEKTKTRLGKIRSFVERGVKHRTQMLRVLGGDKVSRLLTATIHPLNDSVGTSRYYALLFEPHSSTWIDERALMGFNVPVLRVNADRVIVFANREARNIVGSTLSEPIQAMDVVHKDDWKLVDEEFNARLKGSPGEYNIRIKRLDKFDRYPEYESYVRVRVVSIPEKDPEGNFIGAIAYLSLTEPEEVNKALERAVTETTSGIDLCTAIEHELRKLFPNTKIVNIFRWNMPMTHCCVFFSNGPSPQQAWYEMRPVHAKWELDPNESRVSDFKAFIEESTWREFRGDPYVDHLINGEGINSFLRHSCRSDSGRVGIALLSQDIEGYSELDERLLQSIRLDHFLNTALRRFEQEQEIATKKLLESLLGVDSFTSIATSVVRGLRGIFGWDHVSIWRVPETASSLQLVAEENSEAFSKCRRNLDKLPVGKGLRGRAASPEVSIDELYIRNFESTGDPLVNKDHHVRLEMLEKTKSAVALPLKCRGRTVWILSVESGLSNFLIQEDIEKLLGIVRQINLHLDALAGRSFYDQAMSRSSDGIFVTLYGGEIRAANPVALRMLGLADEAAEGHFDTESLPASLAGKNIGEFVFEDWKKNRIVDQDFKGNMPVKLRRADGKTSTVMISRFSVGQRNVREWYFLCKDMTAEELRENLDDIKRLYTEIGVQMKMPISVMNSRLSRIDGSTLEEMPQIEDMIDGLKRQLHRLELTYDRIAYYGVDTSRLFKGAVTLDLRSILEESEKMFLGAAKRRGASALVPLEFLPPPPDPVLVLGIPFQLQFVVDTWVAYLLENAPLSDTVQVELLTEGRFAHVRVSGLVFHSDASAFSTDEKSEFLRLRAQVKLGVPLIVQYIGNHGGAVHIEGVDVDTLVEKNEGKRISFDASIPLSKLDEEIGA